MQRPKHREINGQKWCVIVWCLMPFTHYNNHTLYVDRRKNANNFDNLPRRMQNIRNICICRNGGNEKCPLIFSSHRRMVDVWNQRKNIIFFGTIFRHWHLWVFCAPYVMWWQYNHCPRTLYKNTFTLINISHTTHTHTNTQKPHSLSVTVFWVVK